MLQIEEREKIYGCTRLWDIKGQSGLAIIFIYLHVFSSYSICTEINKFKMEKLFEVSNPDMVKIRLRGEINNCLVNKNVHVSKMHQNISKIVLKINLSFCPFVCFLLSFWPLCAIQYMIYSIQCTFYIVHYTLHNMHYTC